MAIKINYGNKVIALPAAVGVALADATSFDLKVLWVVAMKSYDDNVTCEAIAKELGAEEKDIASSLDFWQKNGVVALSAEVIKDVKPADESATKEKRTDKKILQKSDEAPRYTTEELSLILEKRADASHLIDECQQILGKIFNTHEINVLLGLVDYFALGWDYVVELLEYCAKIGKHSVHYVEKTAIAFMNDGIDTLEALKIKLAELEAISSNENIVRRLFGLKARALTTKEKKYISQWFGKFGFGEDIITKAYEMTVAATNEASMPYANAILERWFGEGLTSVEEIEKAAAARAEAKGEGDGSFDTDDFFEAALQRSYKNK